MSVNRPSGAPEPEITAPSKPRSLKVTKRTRTSVKISWKAPSTNGGSAIKSYRIVKPGKDATVKASTRSYTIKKLKASRSYPVSVEAKNAVGYGPAASITAKTKPAAPKHYRSCAALQKVYPHGVGRSGADDSTSGEPVENFYVSTKLYKMNNGPRNHKTGEYDLDRDNDGIACEKHYWFAPGLRPSSHSSRADPRWHEPVTQERRRFSRVLTAEMPPLIAAGGLGVSSWAGVRRSCPLAERQANSVSPWPSRR